MSFAFDNDVSCDALYGFCKRYSPTIQAVSVIKSNATYCQRLQYSFYQEDLFDLHSCTKSVLSVLVGIAIQKGYLNSEDDLITKYIPTTQVNNPDPRWKALTIKHLLTMRSGLIPDERLLKYPTVSQVFKNVRFESAPGQSFNYNDFNPQLLVLVLENATGMPLLSFADIMLFQPLHIPMYEWPLFKGQIFGGTGLRLTSYGMAKIGWLMTDTGRWNGAQIVPVSYWKNALTDHYSDKYGYYWWLYPDGDFCGIGHDGHYIYGSPDNKIAFSVSSFTNDSLRHKLIEDIRDSVLYAAIPLAEVSAPFLEEQLAPVKIPDWTKSFYNKTITGKSNLGKGTMRVNYSSDSCFYLAISTKQAKINLVSGNGKKQLTLLVVKGQKLKFLSWLQADKETLIITLEEAYEHQMYSGLLWVSNGMLNFTINLNGTQLLVFKQTK